MNNDEEHLRLLSIFHYVFAGLTALFSLFPIIHVIMGLVIVSGGFESMGNDDFPSSFGWFFVIMGSTFILLGMTIATVIFIAGRALQHRRRHTFCLVAAGLACVLMPFGTILGVFTIIVLMRDSVKVLFGMEPAS